MTNDYEMADDNRADLIYEKDSCWRRCCPTCSRRRTPWPTGATDKDYYHGNITADGLREQNHERTETR